MQAIVGSFASNSDHRFLTGMVSKWSRKNFGEESTQENSEAFQQFNQRIFMWTLVGCCARQDIGGIKSLAAATTGGILRPVPHRCAHEEGIFHVAGTGGWDFKLNVEQ